MDEKKIYAEFVNEIEKCGHIHRDTYAMLLDIQHETNKIRQKYGINSQQLADIIDRNRDAV